MEVNIYISFDWNKINKSPSEIFYPNYIVFFLYFYNTIITLRRLVTK